MDWLSVDNRCMSATQEEETELGYQFRFWFVGVQPIIWRRVVLRSNHTLADFHYAIQITCNWSDYFLHQFKIHGQTVGTPRQFGLTYSRMADQVRLSDLELRIKERFIYEYNFIDRWQLEVRLEERCSLDENKVYPLCIGGKRAAPPEDCGGPERFNRLRKHFSPYYIYHRILELHDLYERREQLSEDELYDYEERQQEFSRFRYWSSVDKFDRRTVNKRLKQYAFNDDSWRDVEEVSW
ncbi:MAG: plasmid pRiA4b ORF-3 family protein [Chloroflexi bacterium]|nr:MAG: plasmid pRiA4b ORF-3 family protein [Chloroflexota bacterium]